MLHRLFAGLAPPSSAGYATAEMLLPLVLAVLARAAAADEALIRRVAGGDSRALRQLYDRCAPLALALALRIVRSRSEAEDVVQEAFLEAWKRAGSFDARRGSALSWVLAISRSRALDRLRARGSADRAAQEFAREEAAPVQLPIESAEQRQERERIQAALAALPQEQRAILELAYFEGLTQSEIAARTGDPLGTVKTRCRLALEKLAGLLGEDVP
jgi:RNA polymerase sigma-70 factor (ECF subfamily)